MTRLRPPPGTSRVRNSSPTEYHIACSIISLPYNIHRKAQCHLPADKCSRVPIPYYALNCFVKMASLQVFRRFLHELYAFAQCHLVNVCICCLSSSTCKRQTHKRFDDAINKAVHISMWLLEARMYVVRQGTYMLAR